MRHQCHGGKWSEDEVQAKRIRRHEATRCKNGETYKSHVRAPSCEKTFEFIKNCLEERYDGGHSG